MDFKKALEVLEVSKDVTIEELDEKYFLWIKRKKGQEQRGITNPAELIDMEEKTEAYDVIRNHLHDKEVEKEGKISKGPVQEKIDHFFYYYKFHTIGAVVVIALSFFLIQSIVESRQEQARLDALPPPNLEIMLYGDYRNDDISPFVNNIAEEFPEWERVEAQVLYTPAEIQSEFDIGQIQKNSITLMTEEPDIYIMDLHHFQQFSDDAPFSPLDSYFEDELEEIDINRLYYYQGSEDETERLYGIEITGSDIFDGLEMEAGEKIVTVRADAKNKENVVRFIKRAIEGLNTVGD